MKDGDLVEKGHGFEGNMGYGVTFESFNFSRGRPQNDSSHYWRGPNAARGFQ